MDSPIGVGLQVLVGGNQFFEGNEIVAACCWSQILGRGTGVFAAARRTETVDGTAAQSFPIVTQKGAWVGESATLPTVVALAVAVTGDGGSREVIKRLNLFFMLQSGMT